MEFAIVSVPAAPVRRKARHQSEMVNQLLFGETVEIIKKKRKLWVKIKSLHDGYEGWVTETLLTATSEKAARLSTDFVTGETCNTVVMDEKRFIIPIASSLPGFDGKAGLIGTSPYFLENGAIPRNSVTANADTLVDLTSKWLNVPYLWGGRTIFGIDCSGFVQVNYKMMGVDLPRDAWQQAGAGSKVKNLSDSICGDLAFFDDKEEIVHVGILLSNDRIIHASGKVRIDTIDKKGIINSDSGKHTHSLKAIRRIF
jgi:cell wall-associated NlpC family hydrolase